MPVVGLFIIRGFAGRNVLPAESLQFESLLLAPEIARPASRDQRLCTGASFNGFRSAKDSQL
jgi:hypothetical protein